MMPGMTWGGAAVLRQLQMVATQNRKPLETEFHGPWNKLLYTLFPTHTAKDFTIVPTYMPLSEGSPQPCASRRAKLRTSF
jgi:hypothetical protein